MDIAVWPHVAYFYFIFVGVIPCNRIIHGFHLDQKARDHPCGQMNSNEADRLFGLFGEFPEE